MAGRAWLREEQADLAGLRILEAAGKAFIDLGVSRASMSDIANVAGCSRGTLYRYFKNREALHLAFVNHQAGEIGERVVAALASIEDPRERVTEAILCSVRIVRETPEAAAWFTPDDSGIAAVVSRQSLVTDSLVASFVDRLDETEDAESRRLKAQWIVRVILSLLTMPGRDSDEERALVERFVVAGLLEG